MFRCLTQLNTREAQAQLDNQFFMTDFSDKLEDYYRDGKSYPDIPSLVSEINTDILPNFLPSSGYGIGDVLETVKDPENARAITAAFDNLLKVRRQINLKAELPPYHKDYKFDIIDHIVKDLEEKLAQNKASVKEIAESSAKIDEAVDLQKIDDEHPWDNYVHERVYQNLRAYRADRFKGSSSIENITVSKFIMDGLLKNAFIDVDRKILVDQTQRPGEISQIDRNLKNYRSNLLKDMIERLNIYDNVDGTPEPLKFSKELLTYNGFAHALRLIADQVMSVRYNGEIVNLDSTNKLFEITEEYKRTQHPDLKNIVDNFSDYVILSDFNKLFEYYGEGSIDVSRYNDDFDPTLRKYSTKNALSIDAINAAWDEKVQNGVELASPLYKAIIKNTGILNYTTGRDTGKFLYPTLVTATLSPYFNEIDRYDSTESIKKLLITKLKDAKVPRTEKNVLYTMYKKFFEVEGDPQVVDVDSTGKPKKNQNTEVKSFYNTIRDNQDQSLMELVTKPIKEVAKANYLEAVEKNDGTVGLSIAEPRSKTGVTFTSSRFIEDNINKDMEDLLGTDDMEDPGFIKRWNIKFLRTPESIVEFTSPRNGNTYQLKATNNREYDADTIRLLSKELLGLDFDNDKRHAEFWEEMQSLAEGDEQVAPVYLSYLKDAFNIVEARLKLNSPETKELLREYSNSNEYKEAVTGYRLIDDAIKNDRYFRLRSPEEYKFKLNTQNAKIINDLLYTAENNYTGNQLKSVTPTVEGTTVASYSKYNYSAGLRQNFAAHRRLLSSVGKVDASRSPLYNNLFLNDPSSIDDFFIRGGAKVGSTVKGNSQQTDYETMHFNINLAYFGRLGEALTNSTPAKPVFDTLVFSDKSVNPLPAINNDVLIQSQGRVPLFIHNEAAVDEEQTKNLLYATSGQYYRAYANNILDTWRSIYRAAGIGSLFNEVDAKNTLSAKLTRLNELHTGDASVWKTNTFEHGLTHYEAARYYASKAGVALNNWVHFDNSTKSLGPKTQLTVKPDLIKNVALYDDDSIKPSTAFRNKYGVELVKFANELRDMHFKFDDTARNTIKRLYPTLDGAFMADDINMHLTRGGSKAQYPRDVHPALSKFFYDFNLVRENLTNAAQGTALAHKGSDENKTQLTQNKRNVNMTASITNYSLGLERGVEDFTKTAFVDDLVSYAKGILGNTEPVVVFDGASLETMSQRVKTWHSLNYRFSDQGGTVHKSFISHYDPLTGTFAETKHAAFAMTNDFIRQTIGSNMDLLELHKQLYSTDISTVDITKSWKKGVNLSSFDDVYHYDRSIDFKTGRYGTLYKLDRIEYLGKDIDGKSEYNVYKTNMNEDPSKSMPPVKQHINTMYDLWQVLGGIDSVERTDEKTNFFHFDKDGKTKIYYSPNRKMSDGYMPVSTSAEKLVDFESYIGNPGERIVPEQYIDGSRKGVRAGYDVYKKMFNADGVVNSHLDLIAKWINGDFRKPEAINTLALDLKGHDVKLNATDFIAHMKDHQDDLADLMESYNDQRSRGVVERPYQRFKGKNIDRISFAGAQKVGQYNLNSIETVHLAKRKEWLNAKGLDNDPGIDGVTKLITHQISNLNAGIQLSAWHSTEQALVTTPTQMLSALVFNAKRLGKAKEMYQAIGNIVDKELTYMLGNTQEDIPELVRDLATNYATNKDKLMRIFKDIMENKVAKDKDAEFTLESLIVSEFKHHEFPVDDPQIFHSAVAELTNYFTKSGIRTKFDGLFAVLHPASEMLQVHDVRGGFIPIKDERGGYTLKRLDPNVTTTLQKEQFNEYQRLNEHLSNNPEPTVAEFAKSRKLMNETPRNLKGQQVMIRYADGTTDELSMLKAGETHLIPEARALDIAKTHISDFKDNVNDKAYKSLDEEGKVKALDKYYKDFLKKFKELRTNHPEIEHALSSFKSELDQSADTAHLKGDILKFAYENFSQSKKARDLIIEKLGDKPTRELTWQKEHEYFDKLNTVGMLFVGRLQRFLDHADRGYIDETGNVNHIPASLRNPGLFHKADKLNGARIEVSRAEAIAPITVKKAFMLQEGDTIGSITPELFAKRLVDTLDYYDVNADGVLISTSGKRIYLHNGAPAKGTKANNEHENIAIFGTGKSAKKWFTNDSGDRLFQVPDDMIVTNINGDLHAFLNDKYNMESNPLLTSLDLGFARQGDKFTLEKLGSKEQRALFKSEAEAELNKRAQDMYSSWKVYIDKLIGTRVPGQHFQSFQGMKIVGFAEGNNIHVADEVIMLSGADFDIDKQNIIYHSISGDGRMAVWHPASDLSTEENLRDSLMLPMPQRRTAADFASEMSLTGDTLDKVFEPHQLPDLVNEPSIKDLLGIYHLIEQGYKFNPNIHQNWIDKLVSYEDANVTINAVKNFAVSDTNQIIESPSNFLYLSKGVTTDDIKQFSNRTVNADKANDQFKENPHSVSRQKYDNMMGKFGIGIMASQLKGLSTIQYATNETIRQISDHWDKLKRIQSVIENNTYHMDAIHDPNKLYTGPHTTDELQRSTQALRKRESEIKSEIEYLVNAIGGKDLTLPNLNYDLMNEDFESEGPFNSLHRTSNNKYMDKNKRLAFAKLAQAFDTDVADMDSQGLSTSTDNAKELDLGKINGTPDLLSIYPSMALQGASMQEVISLMTHPISDMLIRNSGKNVYDKSSQRNSMANLLNSVEKVLTSRSGEVKAAAIERLYDNYKLEFTGESFIDRNTKQVYDAAELLHFNNQYYKPAALGTLLAKYLSINQGIASNNWDLYNFSTKLQDVVNGMLIKAKQDPIFNFKSFLDSLATGGQYHKNMISRTSPFFQGLNVNYNPLYILTVNPHFSKQLSAFNASNTILRESSYRVNAMYHIVDKLRDIGYIPPTSNIQEGDFREVEKFIDATIIDSFIKSEATHNKDNHNEAPIFRTKNSVMDLSNPHDRQAFIEWMQTDFMRDIKENPKFQGNAFMQDLRLDSKMDQLLYDNVDYIRLQMDTTNVKQNIDQGPFRDAYVAGLKDVYDNQYKDLHDNNVFNALFWYNLIVNKNNISKNSYAKLLGDVMWQDEFKPNVYSRLFLLKGKVGKSTKVELNLGAEPQSAAFYTMSLGGINFNLRDLFLNYEVGRVDKLPPVRAGEVGEEGEYTPGEEFDDGMDEGYNEDSGQPLEGEEEFGVFDTDPGEFEEGGQAQRNEMYVTRTKQPGVPGTRVSIFVNGKSELQHVTAPSTTLPTSIDRNQSIDKSINYNPFVEAKTELRPDQDQSYNYYKLAVGNIHELLSRLGDAVNVEISVGDGEFEKFDRTKDYNC